MAAPTYSIFKVRYPGLITAASGGSTDLSADDQTWLNSRLEDAYDDLDEAQWNNDDRRSRMAQLEAAHRLCLAKGLGGFGGGSEKAGKGKESQSVGAWSESRPDNLRLALASAGDKTVQWWSSTQYGLEYLAMQRRHMGGPLVV